MTSGIHDHGQTPFARKVMPVGLIGVATEVDQSFSEKYINLLAAIVAKNGLMHPITINVDGRLLAGGHWLAAVKKLGWETVEVIVVSVD
jgi:ParB-like chromosome segregation protein Spo0J